MTKDASPEYLRAQFPLDLTCPSCQATPVRFTVTLPTRMDPPNYADVQVACKCGQAINYGSLPVEFELLTEQDNEAVTSKDAA